MSLHLFTDISYYTSTNQRGANFLKSSTGQDYLMHMRINQTIYTNHTEIRENGINGLITFDCHVKIFINFEIYRKGHCRTERVVLSTIIYTCIVSFVQVHDENKYTEVGYIGYEFNIYNSCCLWVVRRSQ